MIFMFKIIHFVCSNYTLLLADVFENFKYISLIPQNVSQLLGKHGKQLKKTKIKLDLLTAINMLLMVENGIREGICHSVHQYAKANNKFMKDYDKNKES